MLRLYRLKSPYSKENIAEAIITIIKTYKIINKIGYFVLNNAGLNNTYINTIIKRLNIKDIKEYCCLCYFSYIINLLVKVILFSENPEVFKKDITAIAIFRDKKAALQY